MGWGAPLLLPTAVTTATCGRRRQAFEAEITVPRGPLLDAVVPEAGRGRLAGTGDRESCRLHRSEYRPLLAQDLVLVQHAYRRQESATRGRIGRLLVIAGMQTLIPAYPARSRVSQSPEGE
jgi:hypothetical protein